MTEPTESLMIEYDQYGTINAIFPKSIGLYWANQSNEISRMSQLCAAWGEESYPALRRSVPRLAARLTPNWLTMAAFVMSEDIYRTACKPTHWTTDIGNYLAATAVEFLAQISERGFTVHYVIDNVPTLAPGASGPLDYTDTWSGYPAWFRSAGFVYTSPQEEALKLMGMHGFGPDTFTTHWPRYATVGRAQALAIARTAQEQHRHYVYYDADWELESEPAKARFGKPGVVGLFRVDAPVPGSGCQVTMPPGVLEG